MSTDREREARRDWRNDPLPDPALEALAESMWRAWMLHQVGTPFEQSALAWPDDAAPYACEALRCAALHVAAGWMPRPEPGSAGLKRTYAKRFRRTGKQEARDR